MLDYPEPTDFIIATGETRSLKDFVAGCFSCFNLDWQDCVVTSDAFRRPTDIQYSSGNPGKARDLLSWSATIKMRRVLEMLVEAEQVRRHS
jgi:GDPmannose 4,6-dehydratase